MKRLLIPGVALLLDCADAQPANKTSAIAPSPFQGYWISRGLRNILGAGTDCLLRIQEDSEGLSIVRVFVHYPSVNDRKPPTIQTNGPFRVTLGTNSISFVEKGKKQEYTLRMMNNDLFMPAFVPVNDRTWQFKSPKHEGVFQCRFNPNDKTAGTAFPSVKWAGIRKSYAAVSTNESRRIDFRVEPKDGSLVTYCSLVWDKHGSPWFDGSSWYYGFEEKQFSALPEEEFKKRTNMSNKRIDTCKSNRDRFDLMVIPCELGKAIFYYSRVFAKYY